MEIRLSAKETKRFKLAAWELAEFKHMQAHNGRIISKDQFDKLNKLMDDCQVPDRHRNYLRWCLGSLIQFVKDDISVIGKEYYHAVDFCQLVIKEAPNWIALRINSHELHLEHNQEIKNALYETLRPWLIDYSGRFPDRPKKGQGRPPGECEPGKEMLLRNLGDNLINIIGMDKRQARILLTHIGELAGVWQTVDVYWKKAAKYIM